MTTSLIDFMKARSVEADADLAPHYNLETDEWDDAGAGAGAWTPSRVADEWNAIEEIILALEEALAGPWNSRNHAAAQALAHALTCLSEPYRDHPDYPRGSRVNEWSTKPETIAGYEGSGRSTEGVYA